MTNRVHLDASTSAPDWRARSAAAGWRREAARIAGLGATETRRAEERGEFWVVLQDPEGNEFCIQ